MSSKYEKNKNESKTKKQDPRGPLQLKEPSADSWNLVNKMIVVNDGAEINVKNVCD